MPRFRSRVPNDWRRASAIAILAAAITAGCQTNRLANVQQEEPPSASAEPAADLGDLAEYGNAVRRLDSRQLEQQYRALVLQHDSAPSSDAAIRLALLLSAPNASFNDIDQATRFLRDVMYREQDNQQAHSNFAQLLYNLLSERIYAESDDEPMQALLTQERERNEELTAELASVRAALAEERERTDTLQGQLNALKELEEQLSLEDVEP